jgi:hypothetical protein
MPRKSGTRCTVERKMLNEYGRQSCIDLPNYDATVGPGQSDGVRKRQETLTGLTPSCRVA